MTERRPGLVLAGWLLVISACSTAVESGAGGADLATTAPVSTSTTIAAPTTEAEPVPTTTASTTTSSTTTTTTEPELEVYDPVCVVEVAAGDSVNLIVSRIDDDTVNVATLKAENNLSNDVIQPGDLLDVCVDNGLDDVTGEERTEHNAAVVAAATRANVEIQQVRLNELFDGYGIPELLVDGDSGPVTRQRLCAARVAFGLPISTADMEAGSEEEEILMAAEQLPVPFTSSILSERWILIDQTCQIMFVGAGTDELVFVFPTSTGEPGHETRDQDLSPAFRYNPARDNNGWHNSTDFPVEDDNPLNGNMYKPLYFDRGQAIHGANNVPTTPRSKGCARLRVEHQDLLLGWLGFDDIASQTTNASRLDVTVNVQGAYAWG